MAVRIILKNSAVEDKRPGGGVSQLGKGEIGLNSHAAGAFLTCVDTEGNVQQIGGIKVNNDAPSNPVRGTAWLQPSSSTFFVHDGTTWQAVAGGGGGGGGGSGDVDQIIGGDAVDVTPVSGKGTVTISLDPNTNKGIGIAAGQLEAKIGAGLQFDGSGNTGLAFLTSYLAQPVHTQGVHKGRAPRFGGACPRA